MQWDDAVLLGEKEILFTVAAVAAVLSFGGGPAAGAGSAAHQQADRKSVV